MVNNLQFRLFAFKQVNDCNTWVLRNGEAMFVVTDHRQEDDYVLNTCKDEQQIDSVYDVSFHVKNVEESFEKAVCGGAEPVCEPKIIKDAYGEVSIAAVRSCVGDVIHTLLNTDNYTGVFLPGFTECLGLQETEMDQNVHFDHVTYVCTIGDSERVLKWYEKCFGLKRLKINSDEDKDEGFVVRVNDVGMRLKAMEYWRCNSTRFAAASDDNSEQPTIFVIAEPLPGQGKNKIATFLREHRGAGVQHIGLHTPDLVHTVSSLRHSGLEFVQPPEAYYTKVGKLDEIIESGEEVTTLQKYGILLDAETDEVKPEDKNNNRYLMQVFTKPLFNEDTFFFEYVQRCGATGFGAGNISALFRAIQK
ncbi:4-hydroxyphenylpyruvate dioxygenase-like protein [Antedon mediterranea]|uniref:4-hydroxyphenylpyruvate dioxygenase-like protein n=1 Tax=Antedon mediterranea TaxID=105859 RepID=UPI003AF5FA45